MQGVEKKPVRPSSGFRRPRLLGIALSLSVVLGLLHGHILTGFASFMTIRDSLDRADIILPLYQEGHTVPFAAAELYRRGYGDHVAVMRAPPGRLEKLGLYPPPHEVWRRVLEAEGVPAEAIVTVGNQWKDTQDPLGHDLMAIVPGHRRIRIIAVVSSPWSRLSRANLRRRLAAFPVELRIYPVRPREFDERTWWQSRHGWVSYFDVYYLWLIRFLRE